MGIFNLDQAFINEYERTWNSLYEQRESMLKGTVRNEMQRSEKQAFTFIEPTSGIKDRARHSNSPNIPTQHKRRWSFLHQWTWSELVEDMDIIKTLNDPSSAYLKNAIEAANRFDDELILYNIFDTAYTGKDGTTSVNWYDVGECIGIESSGVKLVAGSAFSNTAETGLTLNKIGTIGAMMDNNNVPSNDRHIVVNTDQKWYLLGHARATSSDYASGISALVNGQIPNNYFLGFYFHFLPTDRFVYDTVDTGAIKCAAYQKDALLRTVGYEMKTRLTEESSSNYAVRVFAEFMVGGCRLQGPGIVPIALDPDPAVSFAL